MNPRLASCSLRVASAPRLDQLRSEIEASSDAKDRREGGDVVGCIVEHNAAKHVLNTRLVGAHRGKIVHAPDQPPDRSSPRTIDANRPRLNSARQ